MKIRLKETDLKESYAIINYWDDNGVQQEKIFNGTPKSIESKAKRLADRFEVISIHQASADLKDNQFLNSLGEGILRLDYNSSEFKESEDLISPDEIIKFMYNTYPDAAYIGFGTLPDGSVVLNYDRFPEEAIDNLLNKFGPTIAVRQSHSEYAPEIKKTAIVVHKAEPIEESSEYPKDNNIIDFKNASDAELKKWLDDNNDKSEHSDAFNKLWLKVYKYAQRRKELVKESEYEEIASKSIPDSDGFTTDYTLYKNKDTGKYVCVFGDKDIYRPEDEDFDFETDYEDEAKEWFDDYKGFEEGEGTQVDDIAKKEDFPKFKVGKKITNLVEDEVTDNLEPEEKEQLDRIQNDRIIKGYKCKKCKKEIKNITDFKKKAFKDRTEYFCPYCGEPYDFEDLKDIELKESHGTRPSSQIFEYYSSEKEAREVAEELKKEGKYEVEEIIPQGAEFAIWVHPVGDEEKKYLDSMKKYAPKMYKDKMKKESYNYIGTDVDEPPRDDKSHKEKIFTVYDQYGEIGEYHTREEAQKVIDEWYNDPELYGEEGPQLRIEEDIIDVLNNKIVVPDDLAN